MRASLLLRISPPDRTSPSALRALLSTRQALGRLPGFRSGQAFRALDPTNSLLFLTDWESAYHARSPLVRELISAALSRHEALGGRLERQALLDEEFRQQFLAQPCQVTLLRLSTETTAFAQESRRCLQALAAPGTVRTRCALSLEEGVLASRLDFDSEDALWGFMDSPLRQRWSSSAEGEETWAINVPRLEGPDAALRLGPAPLVSSPPRLAVELEVAEASAAATMRLHGVLDEQGVLRCRRSCEYLVRSGCRDLTVDLTSLQEMPGGVLELLTATARQVKAQGGRFSLIDNTARFRRVTRPAAHG